MARYKDVFGGLFWLIVAAAMYYASFGIRKLAIGGGSTSFVGSGFMPRLVASGMIILSATIIWKELKKVRDAGKAGCVKEELSLLEKYLPVVVSLVLFTAYIALMEIVGFVIMTVIYLFGQMLILAAPEHRKPIMFAVIAVVGAVAINYTFIEIFQLMLPESRLF